MASESEHKSDEAQTERKPWTHNWRLIVSVATVGALLALAVVIRGQLVTTFQNLFKVHAWALVALVPIEFANYDAQARLYRSLFGVVGDKLHYWFSFKLSLELNFVNQVFPSGGVSGISYFGVRLRSEGLAASRAVLIQIVKLFMTWISFELILIVGLFVLAAGGHANNLTILFAAALSTLVVVGTFLFIFVVGSRKRIDAVTKIAVSVINWLIRLIPFLAHYQINIERLHSSLDELHGSYLKFQSHLGQLQRSFWQAIYMNLVEVAALYAVFLAFGHAVNPGAIILAYAVANFAGLISVLPGGVGVYEALMTAVLVITGVPAAVSLPAVVMYRILNTLIQLPPGYYLYHRSLRSS